MYLASIIEVATNFCFLLIYKTSPLERVNIFLRIETLLVLSIAKSKSKYPYSV